MFCEFVGSQQVSFHGVDDDFNFGSSRGERAQSQIPAIPAVFSSLPRGNTMQCGNCVVAALPVIDHFPSCHRCPLWISTKRRLVELSTIMAGLTSTGQ